MKYPDLSVSAISVAQSPSKANTWFRLLWHHFIHQRAYHGAKINVTFTILSHPPSPLQVGFKDLPKINEWAVLIEVAATPWYTEAGHQSRGAESFTPDSWAIHQNDILSISALQSLSYPEEDGLLGLLLWGRRQGSLASGKGGRRLRDRLLEGADGAPAQPRPRPGTDLT